MSDVTSNVHQLHHMSKVSECDMKSVFHAAVIISGIFSAFKLCFEHHLMHVNHADPFENKFTFNISINVAS